MLLCPKPSCAANGNHVVAARQRLLSSLHRRCECDGNNDCYDRTSHDEDISFVHNAQELTNSTRNQAPLRLQSETLNPFVERSAIDLFAGNGEH